MLIGVFEIKRHLFLDKGKGGCQQMDEFPDHSSILIPVRAGLITELGGVFEEGS